MTLLHHPTLDRLQQLRLTGMARALAAQAQQADIGQLGFEERLGMLLDSEAAERESRQNAARLKRAKLKQAATPEDVDFRHPRGLDRALFTRLMAGDWLKATLTTKAKFRSRSRLHWPKTRLTCQSRLLNIPMP